MKRFAGKWWWRICLFLALAGSARPSAAGGLAEAWEPAAARLALDLEELARWCQAERLFARRDLAYEALLLLEPEHRDARRFLRHERQRDGSFKPSERARPAKDRDTEKLAEYEALRGEAIARFRAPLLALVDGTKGGAEPAELERLWSMLLALDPDDARARAARGEVQDAASGTWVLRETAAAREREGALERALEAVLAEIGTPSAGVATEAEADLGPRWTVRTTEHVRVLGTGGEAPIADCARGAEAALRLFAVACATDPRTPSDYSIYILATEADRDLFLSRHPRLDAARRAEARRCSSYWIPDTTELAIFPATAQLCLDQAVRQSIALMSVRHYAIGPEEGWAFEGLGGYLTAAITGSSFTHYGRGASSASESERPLQQASAWIESAQTASEGSRASVASATRLEQLLRASAASFDAEERRLCTALFRYLIEGRPGEVDTVLTFAGRESGGVEALERALGCRIQELEARLARFEREVGGTESGRVDARAIPR